MSEAHLSTCALCPRLCRPACPVAVGSHREAATPTAIAGALFDWERGLLAPNLAAEAVTLCVNCGACAHHCHIGQPLPTWLAAARARLTPCPEIEVLRPIEGEANPVIIETDPRPLAAAVAKRLGRPVARWRTEDRLGVAAIEHPPFADQAERLRAHAAGRALWVADGGAFEALSAAGLAPVWLHVALGEPGLTGSCRAPGEAACAPSPGTGLSCCGAAGPLAAHHPPDAARVARAYSARLADVEGGVVLADARCASHLAASGVPTPDWIERLVLELS